MRSGEHLVMPLFAVSTLRRSISTFAASLTRMAAAIGVYAHVVPQSQTDAVEVLASALSSGQLLTRRRESLWLLKVW